jgi:hypothetical protein
VVALPSTEPVDELDELEEDELDVLPLDVEEEELEVLPVDEDEEEELDDFPEDDELEDELLELDGVGSTTPPPQANSAAVVASTPVSLIARLTFDSDLILSIVITLLVLVLTRFLVIRAGEDAVRNFCYVPASGYLRPV